jgi:hypothetical protein
MLAMALVVFRLYFRSYFGSFLFAEGAYLSRIVLIEWRNCRNSTPSEIACYFAYLDKTSEIFNK